MATFVYEAMSKDGKEVKDEIEAQSSEDALAKIRSLGYFPTKIREKGAKKKIAGKAAAAGPKKKAVGATGLFKVKTKILTQFTRQLSTLQDAGLPILRSLRILEQQQKPGKMKLIIRQVADDVEGGSSLSEAMSRHPKAFDRLYVNMVQAGEAGGVLDTILQRLADFKEKAQKLKRKVVGAMIYPSVVIAFAVAIVTGIMIVVVPKFKQIFLDFNTQLPTLTLFLIKLSDWMVGKYVDEDGRETDVVPGWIFILFAPLIVFLLLKLIRQSQMGRYAVDSVKIKIPIMGQIVAKSGIARFTRTLGTLISAGVPILEALNITKETSDNEVYSRAIGNVHDAIREGDSFANPLRASKVVDSLVVNMVDVGEETGDLDKMLMKVADNYDEEVEVLVAGLVSLLEPVMVVVLGGIVGFIVLALFLPLVTLINSVSSGGA